VEWLRCWFLFAPKTDKKGKNKMATFEEMAEEITRLMDECEKNQVSGSSKDGDPVLVRLSELVTLVEYFAPELLDTRIKYSME
jgi:hypothetical protein